jgi:hypothetical protein
LHFTIAPVRAVVTRHRRWPHDREIQVGLLELDPDAHDDGDPEPEEIVDAIPDDEYTNHNFQLDYDEWDYDPTWDRLYDGLDDEPYEPWDRGSYDYRDRWFEEDQIVWEIDECWWRHLYGSRDLCEDYGYRYYQRETEDWILEQELAEAHALWHMDRTSERDFGLAQSPLKPGVESHRLCRRNNHGKFHSRDMNKRGKGGRDSDMSEKLFRGLARNPLDEDWGDDEFVPYNEVWVDYPDIEWRDYASTHDGDSRSEEPDEIDHQFVDIKVLMCSLPGETEPPCAAWFERFDYRDDDPDALITGTTEPAISALAVF